MAFKTFVQVGRAVLIAKGPEAGKLGVIGTVPSMRLWDRLLTYCSGNHQ